LEPLSPSAPIDSGICCRSRRTSCGARAPSRRGRFASPHRRISAERIDVALRAWPLDDASDLFAFRLATSVTGVYVAPSYARERGVPKVPSDLAKHDCILVGSGTPKTWSFRTHKPVAVTGRVRVDNVRLARALAVHGAGVVRTARIFGDVHVAKGELVPVLENQWPDTPIHAVHAGANPPSPKVRAFVEIARKMVGHVFQSELR
jgi:DNA-binding transcriptional LysR family regulator